MTPFQIGLVIGGLAMIVVLVFGYAVIKVGHAPEEK